MKLAAVMIRTRRATFGATNRLQRLTTAMFNTKTVKLNHLTATEYDYETFHIPPLMSERTICIQDEGGWSGVGGSAVEH